MTGIHHDQDGVIDMLPAETVVHLKKVHDTGAILRTEWASVRDKLQKEMEVGNGPLGKEFMGKYKPAAISVDKAAREVPGVYQGMANNGYRAVQIYEGADAEATHEFPPA
ncbi:hypothetical protein [Amycolatopsis regifaucium]|uniref:Uncharacterized protein n=1 Tax=Amycolatopsis regifaucium TaxID=546365 RepID=A0A154M9Z3_9PSEU|nr:hypothetical protein [Amycolatopsis regifaucium]KZB81468.1 hypothetical protein AVL48_05515 [Amycolatopsis regifaucium]OKA04731.1 hypothetical protein ATP06_0230530 [Amycolatopsis regifaucium]SFH30543.1 hypothetical protein SAMN04489731_103445 [Amycolatopsis regifaucium]